MPDNVQSAMFEILKKIQTDMSGLKADVSGLKADVSELKTDVAWLKGNAIKQRRDSAAMLVMFRSTVGHFNERVSKLEDDVQLLKDRR
jgi:polyhydroxyalkanoate synthesis regulator phasin